MFKKPLESFVFIKFFTALTLAIVFYFVWLEGAIYIKSILRPWVHDLEPSSLKNFLLLDLGRLWGRIWAFLWTVIVATPFVYFRRYELGVSLKKWKSFFAGFSYGAVLVLVTLLLAWGLGAFRVTEINQSQVLLTLCLYLFAMTLTSVAEELAVRGVLMGELKKVVGLHGAVILTAIFFGFWHLKSSPIYAVMAGLKGLTLGYSRHWYGLLFPIGVHLAWNMIETSIFAGSMVSFEILEPLVIGDRLGSPDRQGWSSLPVILVGLVVLVGWANSKKRESAA